MEKKQVTKAEAEANERAIKQVATMLQRPDQLDKVEQCRRRVAREKASVEARLKAAVQSHLDGVKTGLSQLKEALNEVKEIKENMVSMDDMYSSCGTLSSKMRDIKDISARHRQLATAMENLKYIFGVPEEVAKARQLIADGQLLEAHKILTDLEASRDGLLFEQYKLQGHHKSDINQLTTFFADAEALSNELGQALWKILRKAMPLVRKDSSIIVTALRIVEREHRTDTKMENQEKIAGFLPPLRPKNWRQIAMENLKEAVEERIDSDMYAPREQDAMWLVRHLEILRKYCVEDLRVAKFLCAPCFPPTYNIFQQYVHWYHLALSSHLQMLIEEGLEGSEIISLLTWLNQYTGDDFMGHAELGLDVNNLPALLDDTVSEQLMNSYFNTTKDNMLSWTKKSLQQDVNDWKRDVEPEVDVDGYYGTSLPVILFQMVQQTIQVAETISSSLKRKVFNVCIKEMNNFVRSYAEAITTYKEEHFVDREQPPYYPLYMVAVTNDCEAFTKFAVNLLQMSMEKKESEFEVESAEAEFLRMDREMDDSLHDMHANDPLLKFRHEMDNVAQASCGFLLDEVFLDLKPHCDGLLLRSWLNDSSSAIDTICVTIEDYYHDYIHLKPKYFAWIMREAERRVVLQYMRAVLGRRVKLSNNAERMKAGEKLLKEQQMLASLFDKLSSSNERSPCEVLIPIAEVIKLQDKSMMSLELSGLVNKYQDATAEHMQALLAIRGDFSASEAKELIVDTIKAVTASSSKKVQTETLYSLVSPPSPKLPARAPAPSIASQATSFLSKFSTQ